MPIDRFELVDSLTFYTYHNSGGTFNFSIERGATETLSHIYIAGGQHDYKQPVYIFNGTVADGIFISARLIIPTVYDNFPSNSRTSYRLASRPPIGTTNTSDIIGNINAQYISAPIYDPIGQTYTINIPSLELLHLALTNGINLWCSEFTSTFSASLASINSINKPYIEYQYADESEPPLLTNLSPHDISINGDANNLFTWTYYQAAAAPQTHVDIQYLYANEWQDIAVKEPLSVQQYTVPPGILNPGSTQWRMRAYCNNGNSVSEYVYANITIRAKPGDPVINGAIGYPRPSIAWTDDGQQVGFRVRITTVGIERNIIDTKTVYSQNRFWRPNTFLTNGVYTIHLSTVNSDQVWSNEVTVEINVQNVPGQGIELSSRKSFDHSIELSWSTQGAYTQFIIIKNGKAIANTQEKYFKDYYAIDGVSYIIRGMYGEYYTDSNERSDCLKVHNAVISCADEISWMELRVRRGEKPRHEINMVSDVTYLRFENRTRPHKQTPETDYRTVTHNLYFTLRNRSEYERLKKMINKVIIYKDCTGEIVSGNLTKVEQTIDNAYDVTIIIDEIDSWEIDEFK